MAAKRVNGKFVKEEATEIRQQVAKTSIEIIQSSIAKAQNEAVKTLAGVQEQAVNALNELATVKKAIEVEQQELERIHGAAAIAKEIEEAEQFRDDTKANIQRELEAFKLEISDKKTLADREYAEKVRQNNEASTRAQGLWSYEFENKKRDEQATWEEAKRLRDLEEKLRVEAVDRNLAERQSAISKQEKDIFDLKARVEAFPAELDKAVKKESAIVTNSLTRDHTHAIEILTSKFNAEKTVQDNTISSLRAESANKDRVIEQLQVRLNASEEKVSTIATKALDTAASVKAQADANTTAAISATNGTKRA